MALVPRRTASRVPSGRSDRDGDRDGQQVHAGGQRAVGPDELEVLGHQEDEAGQGEERDGDRGAGGAEAHVREQPHVEHRLAGAALADDECDQQDSGAGEPEQRRRRRPAPARSLDDGVDQQPHEAAGQDQAREVQAVRRRVLRAGDEPRGQGDDGQRHRPERVEDARPAVVLEQEAAHDRPEGDGHPGRGSPQADGQRPLLAAGEHPGQQRQRGRERHRRPEAHDGPRGDQPGRGRGVSAGEAGQAEHRSPAISMPLRPNRSDRLPEVSSSAAKTRL